jgi:two-component system, OmpR family, response regulator RegX3
MAQIMEASITFPSATPPLILIVDDEPSYRDALTSGLGAEGFAVATAADAASAMEQFMKLSPDLVLLDVMLPDRPGTEVCREMTQLSNIPVIMVSARDDEIDIVLGLELGATDYVAKPYRLRELIARIRTVLRRQGTDANDDEIIEAGPVRMDSSRRSTWVRSEQIELSRKEFDLLWLLVTNAGRVVTRETCIDTLWWGQDLSDTRTLDTHVKRLRRKIEVDPTEPDHLLTIRGVGFRFDT